MATRGATYSTWKRRSPTRPRRRAVRPSLSGAELERARQLLFAAREKRVHPHKDDKVLTDWNGLMIAALARGSQVLGERALCGGGREGPPLHHGPDDRSRTDGFSIATGMEKLRYRQTWTITPSWSGGSSSFTRPHSIPDSSPRPSGSTAINWRISGTRRREASFSRPMTARSFCSARRTPMTAPCRRATRSPCSISCRLARMTGDADLENKAAQLGRALSGKVEQFPAGFTQLLCALSFALGPSHEVVLAGAPESADAASNARGPQIPFHTGKGGPSPARGRTARKGRPFRSWPLF